MIKISPRHVTIILVSGDVLVLFLVTIIGFASHSTLGTTGSRMITTENA